MSQPPTTVSKQFLSLNSFVYSSYANCTDVKAGIELPVYRHLNHAGWIAGNTNNFGVAFSHLFLSFPLSTLITFPVLFLFCFVVPAALTHTTLFVMVYSMNHALLIVQTP